MARVRCETCGRPDSPRYSVTPYAPVGHPDSGLICGSTSCREPGLVWLLKDEERYYANGKRIFPLNNENEKGVKLHVARPHPIPPVESATNAPKSPPTIGDGEPEESILNSKLIDQIKERQITRLVHFTRLSSLAGIIRDRSIKSTRSLLDSGSTTVVNDAKRLDGHLDYVCCSVEYPNVYLLDRYRAKDFGSDWIILFLYPILLSSPMTRFSPVNASTQHGIHVKDGIDGFNSMFEDYVSPRVRRSPYHRRNAPTDIQAEVLLAQSVPSWAISGIAVEFDAVANKVATLLKAWTVDKPLPDWHTNKPSVDVQKDLFSKTELRKIVRGYRR